MVLKGLIWRISTGGAVVILKVLLLYNFYFGRVCYLERTDFE